MQQYNVDNVEENAGKSWHFSIAQKKNIKLYTILIIIGFLYCIEIKYEGFSIPCVINLITGRKCPGCGTTRAIMSTINGDLKTAFYSNPFVVVTSPLLVYFLFKSMLFNCGVIKNNINKVENIILYVYIALFLIYGIVRNIV